MSKTNINNDKNVVSLENNNEDENKSIINGRNEDNILFKRESFNEQLKLKFNNENKNDEIDDFKLHKGKSVNIIKTKLKIEDNMSKIKKKKKKNKNKNKVAFKTNDQNNNKNIQKILEENEEMKKNIIKNIINDNLLIKKKNKQKNYNNIKLLKNLYEKNKNNEKEKNKKKKKKKSKMDLYDEYYDFDSNDTFDDLLIIELKKIDYNEDLKIKLIENRKKVIIILEKNPKTTEDYQQLNFCRKRIKYIIRKIIENLQKENLTIKPKINLFLPKSLKDRKILYKFLRSLEIKIKKLLETDNQLELSVSEVESEDEISDLSDIHFFSFLPNEYEMYYKLKLEEEKNKLRKSKLIYDNLYLYQNKRKKVQIKQEVNDILNEKNGSSTDKKATLQNPTGSPSKRGKFAVRKKKFIKKHTFKYILKKLEDEEVEIKKENKNDVNDNNDIILERRINKFTEKIKKLKRGEINLSDYDDEISELMTEQIDKNKYEGDKIKELRIFNFFNNFQTTRKSEMYGKDYYRKRFIFNSPLNITFYPKMPKIKSADSIN